MTMDDIIIFPAKSFHGPIALPSRNHVLDMRVLIGGAEVADPALAWFPATVGAHITIVERAKPYSLTTRTCTSKAVQ